MIEGYLIDLSDKTTCDSEVLDGDKIINLHGLLHTCEGVRVTVGRMGKLIESSVAFRI